MCLALKEHAVKEINPSEGNQRICPHWPDMIPAQVLLLNVYISFGLLRLDPQFLSILFLHLSLRSGLSCRRCRRASLGARYNVLDELGRRSAFFLRSALLTLLQMCLCAELPGIISRWLYESHDCKPLQFSSLFVIMVVTFHNSLKTLKSTISTSSVSISSRTSSPVSLNFGTAIKRTVCPAGPSMTVVSKAGWLPTK